MSDQIKQIAERLRGLRDVLELTSQEVAESCQLTVEEYLGMESGVVAQGYRWNVPKHTNMNHWHRDSADVR